MATFFETPPTLSAGDSPARAAPGDLKGEVRPDAPEARANANKISVLAGEGMAPRANRLLCSL
jgi:hypothetical protein